MLGVSSPMNQNNGDLPKFSSTKEDAPGYVPPKEQSYIKVNPMDHLQGSSGKTPTDVFRETGKNTVKDLEKIFKKYDTPSGYYTPDVKLMGKGYGMNK